MKRSWLLGAVLALGLAGAASAQVTVAQPWARSTVSGQKATGAFMTITSASGARLLAAASPVAGVVEIHEMSLEGHVMKMRALPEGLALPPGKAVELKPGGYHVMLMDLKEPLKVGSRIKIELRFESADRKAFSQTVEAEVRAFTQSQH